MKLNGTYQEYCNHRRHYYAIGGAKRTGQRLGQYIWNMMGAKGKSWPQFFYCEDPRTVEDMALAELCPLL